MSGGGADPAAPDAPHRLRAEHLEEAFGIGEARPRLSWWLPSASTRQLAYRVRAGDWDSGRIDSADSVLVPYAGPVDGPRVTWQVKVWTDLGESEWSEPAWWESARLDLPAAWIEPAEEAGAAAGSRPAQLLRREFTLPGPVRRARLYATAHGVYEMLINGVRVGDAELTPGWTAYRSRLAVQTYDVTGLLTAGPNAVGAILSDGWWRGQTGFTRNTETYGDRTALLAVLEVEHADATTTLLSTDAGWRAAPGGILAADLIAGQTTDLRREPRGWAEHGFDDGAWPPVRLGGHRPGGLVASPAPPVRRIEEISPVAVTEPRPGVQVIDLGQNINGWIRLHDLGPAGTETVLTYGEALGPDGDLTMDHLAPWDFATGTPLSPGQVDRVISAGVPGEVFEPRHTTHGFQYVRLEGHRVGREAVTGVVVHSDLRRTGWFECDDERINRLHEAAVWSFRGNACDIPTDCPTRERVGWTGDWQIYVPTAAFLYDVAGFSVKWLRDLSAEQAPDGRLPGYVPMPLRTPWTEHPLEGHIGCSAGWGDAAVLVPWELWRAYGDLALLAEQWDSMTAWVDWAAGRARDARHPDRAARRPEPAPYETHLWDTGFHWGEWLEPGMPEPDFATFGTLDNSDIATAYLHLSARRLAQIAELLGRADAARHYAELADGARLAWQAEFLDPAGGVRPATQAAHVRALAFDLVPGELRAATAARLVALIRAAGTHLGTGFLATPYLLPVLADTGHLDLAYELLLRDTPPSWLAMLARGATTIWERWEGIDDDGVPHYSLNHYSKGAVVSFLHSWVAGITPLDAGYRRLRIAPRPGGGLTWARAAHDCPYGRIESRWRIDGDRFTLRVRVPPGTSATVELPDGSPARAAGPGDWTYECPSPTAHHHPPPDTRS